MTDTPLPRVLSPIERHEVAAIAAGVVARLAEIGALPMAAQGAAEKICAEAEQEAMRIAAFATFSIKVADVRVADV